VDYHPNSIAGQLKAQGYSDEEVAEFAPKVTGAILRKYVHDFIMTTPPEKVFGGLTALPVVFSPEQEAQIRALVKKQDILAAQRIILDELAKDD